MLIIMFPRYIISFLLFAFMAIICNEVFAVSLKETDVEEFVDQGSNHPPILPEVVSLDSEFDSTEFEDDDEEDEFYFLRAGRRTQTSTTQRKNIFQKLGESLVTSIIGCLLIIFVPFVIWKNEGRHVDQLSRIDFCKNNAVVVDCNTSSNENVGRLVHFNGNVTVGDSAIDFGPEDKTLNLTDPISGAIILRRTCYIYQTFETAQQSTKRDVVGGGETRTTTYTRKDDWTHMGPQEDCVNIGSTNSRGIWDQLVAATGGSNESVNDSPPPDAATAKQQDMLAKLGAMQNQAGPMPLEIAEKMGLYNPDKAPQGRTISPTTRVGEFAIMNDQIISNPAVFASEYTSVPMEYLPDTVLGCESLCKGSDNVLRTFKEGQEPQNGDIKIAYEYAADGFEATFVVAQTATVQDEAKYAGAKFGVDQCHVDGRCNKDLGQIWMIRKGIHNLQEMIGMSKKEEAAATKIIRIVVWVALCAGWIMIFAPLLTMLQVLPLLSSIGFFAVIVVAVPVSLLCCATVMLLAYMRYRPVITGGLLVVALGIWGIVAWRLQVANEIANETSNSTTTRF